MSTHIGARPGDIAEIVLLPGDPLRAKWVADNFLTRVNCYSGVRNMFGFTGIAPNGKRVSVQGAGMGQASLSIYVNELVDEYGVKKIIRVGSTGGIRADVQLRDILIAMGSCSDSGMNLRRFPLGTTFAPIANPELFIKACEIAKNMNISVKIGNVLATDLFYDKTNAHKVFAKYGVLSIEMETSEFYTLAAEKGFKALTLLTVSDSLVKRQKSLSSDEREKSFTDMMKIALELVD